MKKIDSSLDTYNKKIKAYLSVWNICCENCNNFCGKSSLKIIVLNAYFNFNDGKNVFTSDHAFLKRFFLF